MRKLLFIAALLVVVFAILASLIIPPLVQSVFYPEPKNLAAVNSESVESLLSGLQEALDRQAPQVAAALQPGLTDAEISALEAKGGLQLSEDLRSLYRWHNGIPLSSAIELVPGHEFPPLEAVVEEKLVLTQGASASGLVANAVGSIMMGHRKRWASIFPDGAGDGYFYDSSRETTGGAFFYHMGEDAYYRWFPSFRNFVAGLIQCMDEGAIRYDASSPQMAEEDFEKSWPIWDQHSSIGGMLH